MNNRVELVNICKSFNGIPVLRNVTFRVKPGEVHGLVGENGAGKSTLMKVLSGAYQKDSGKILLDGLDVNIKNPYDGRKMGIGIIYQELSIIPDLSVAENVYLHQLADTGWWVKWNAMKQNADKLIRSFGFQIKPAQRAGSLSIAQQQVIEIAKALSENIKVLVLDEPTSVLGTNETKKLFEILVTLKKEGVAIIFISHRLEEIFKVCDKITVLKDGQSSEGFLSSQIDNDGIIKLMLGRSLNAMFPTRSTVTGDEILRVDHISSHDKVYDVSLSLRRGEVLGIAGLVGSGRTKMIRAVFGADKKMKGRVSIDRKEVKYSSPYKTVKAGMGLVPEDRKNQGIIQSLSVRNNLSLTNYNQITGYFGFIRKKKEDEYVEDLIKKLRIKIPSKDIEAGKLSGGNQQKVVLAKWFSKDCKVIIIDEPTRGVDIGAKVEIYELIDQLAGKGAGIVIVSSESTELMGICNRIMVMHKGKVNGILNKEEFSEENILRLAIG